MANHVAHLFIRQVSWNINDSCGSVLTEVSRLRDTVSMFSERIHQNDEEDTDHFENIQSTNW